MLILTSLLKLFGCDIERITFEHIFAELDQQFEEVTYCKDSWKDETEVVAVFERRLRTARSRLALLRANVDYLGCIQKKVVELTRSLLDRKEDKNRKILMDCVLDVSSDLFDLYLLHSVLSLRNKAVRKIALSSRGGS